MLAPRAASALIDQFVRVPARRTPPTALADLTDRELEVLRLLGQGLSNAGLSRELGVGAPTIKTHVSRVLCKLGLASRVQAALLARELDL